MSASVALPFRIGPRTVWRVRRRLRRVALSLDQVRGGHLPSLGTVEGDGFLLISVPADRLPELLAAHPGLKPFVRQRYPRFFADLRGSFDDYLAGFSSKSRSTLKRKVRKLVERSGGALDLRCYRTPDEIDDFYRKARAISARSYQERLLDAGLPEGDAALAEMRDIAARGAVRAWILSIDGRPASYLYAPADGLTLVYAYLGYDPDFADFSPGTVLQYEAMRQLIGEQTFRLFDFTEGEGQHKKLFATGEIACADLLLLRRSPANLLLGASLDAFDRTVALAKAASKTALLQALARRARR